MSALRSAPAAARLAVPVDDYPAFCAGVQRLCGVDLAQYKRGQMERRIRSFAQRRGVEDAPDLPRDLQRDRGELDEFLDRVTINVSQLWRNPEQWTALQRDVIPELAARRPPARLERRLLLRRRGLHARGDVRRGGAGRARPDRRHGHRPPHGRPRPRGALHRRGRPHRAQGRPAALVRARRRRLVGGPRDPPQRALRDRRPAAHALPARGLRPRPVPQHRHLLHRGRARRAARAPRRGAAPRRVPRDRLHRARRRAARAGAGEHPALHLPQGADGRSPTTSPSSSPSPRSTSRRSTSPSCASRSTPTTARRSTRSSASRTR